MLEMSTPRKRGRPKGSGSVKRAARRDGDVGSKDEPGQQSPDINAKNGVRLDKIIALLEEIAYQGTRNMVEREAFLTRVYNGISQ